MTEYTALLSIVYMMGYVLVFDRIHWRRQHIWSSWARHLMSQEESELILKILAASSKG